MAVIINNVDEQHFEINGIRYLKHFVSIVTNDKLKILNVYDSLVVLQDNLIYSDFTVDTVTHVSAQTLQLALVDILLNRNVVVTLTSAQIADVSAIWTGVDFNFDVIANNFPVANKFYEAIPGPVSLNPAHATLDRTDLIGAFAPVYPATIGTVGKITGEDVAQGLVVPPDYDRSLFYPIKPILVKANSTTPSDPNTGQDTILDVAFDENIEWTFSTNQGQFAVNGNDAYSGLLSIDGTNITLGSKIGLSTTAFEGSTISEVSFWIKLKANYGSSSILLRFRNATSQVGNTVGVSDGNFGFSKNNFGWQKIIVDASNFNLSGNVDEIEIMPYKNFAGCFVDLVEVHLNGSSTNTGTVGIEEAPLDGKSWFRKNGQWVEYIEHYIRVDMGIGNVLNWINPNGTFKKVMTGPTTFVDSNLPQGVNTKVITMYLSGNFTPTFPIYWLHLGGDYDGALINQITIECVNGAFGSEEIYYNINPIG